MKPSYQRRASVGVGILISHLVDLIPITTLKMTLYVYVLVLVGDKGPTCSLSVLPAQISLFTPSSVLYLLLTFPSSPHFYGSFLAFSIKKIDAGPHISVAFFILHPKV